jgi:hypothetical protein
MIFEKPKWILTRGTYFSFSAAMEEHRATCEAEGRYVEAEMAKNRINELRE